MKHLCLLIGILLSTSVSGYPQSNPAFVHTLHGTFKDTNGAVMSGLHTVVSKDGIFVRATDENGEFKIDLPPGEYTFSLQPLYNFKAFINITDTGPNPDNVDFIIDTKDACCSHPDGTPFPLPTLMPKPYYPAAAAATRTFGEVVVSVKIGTDGKVTAAKTQSGHPLLRAASEAAARGARFETGEKAEREAFLFYRFLLEDKKPRDGVTQYINPYTVKIISRPLSVDTDTFNEPKRTP